MQAHRVEGAQDRKGATVVCVMRDVTERRAQDEELARGHAEALKANDIKARFLATVSHELRTPLNAIIGFSEMLSMDEAGRLDVAKRAEYAGIIHASGNHLLDVVNTLLDISKIESGAMSIERDPLDVAALAKDCCALMALRAETGGIALEHVLGPALPQVEGTGARSSRSSSTSCPTRSSSPRQAAASPSPSFAMAMSSTSPSPTPASASLPPICRDWVIPSSRPRAPTTVPMRGRASVSRSYAGSSGCMADG